MRRLAGLTTVMILALGASLGCGGEEDEKPPARPTVGSLAGVQSRLEAAGYKAVPNVDDFESVEAVGGLYISKAGEKSSVRVKRYASAKNAATAAGELAEEIERKVFGTTLVYWVIDDSGKLPADDLRRIMKIVRAG